MSEQQHSPEEMSMAEAVFRTYLYDRGLKYTPERRTLLEEILSTHQHFEAEELLVTLRQAGKRVAKATIYRTLPLLVECGIVKQVQFGDKMARYEHVLGHAPHDHIVCRQCGRIVEFDSSEVAGLRDSIAQRHGFQPSGHRFQITGVCSECGKK
jgi:Fur family transcriptional regulator, ferric uptake regulator